MSEVSSSSKQDKTNSLGKGNVHPDKLRKKSIFKNFENAKLKNNSPVSRNLSPERIKKIKDDHQAKLSLNDSFQQGEESCVSNPSIMETDGNKIKNISPIHRIKGELKRSGFSNFYKKERLFSKQNEQAKGTYNSGNVYSPYVQRSMNGLEQKPELYTVHQQQDRRNYQNLQKIDSVNSLELNAKMKRKISVNILKPRRTVKGTTISRFGRASPKNFTHQNSLNYTTQGVKLRPLHIKNLKDSDLSDDSISSCSYNGKKGGDKPLLNFEDSASVSVSSEVTETVSVETPTNKEGKKLMRFKFNKKRNLQINKKPSIDMSRRGSYMMMARGHSKIFKASRLDITMNNLDIQYVGEYQLLRLLGKGSFAKVLKARKKGVEKNFVRYLFLNIILKGFKKD